MIARPKPIDSRAKGQAGEREFARLIFNHLGIQMARNLDQSRQGGCDLEVPGLDPVSRSLDRYAFEVKRWAAITPALLSRFWSQTEAQAHRASKIPALAFRADRQEWRVVLPLHILSPEVFQPWDGIEWTAEISVPAFSNFIRESSQP